MVPCAYGSLFWFNSLAYHFEMCMRYSEYGEVCMEVVVVNKKSITPCKRREYPILSYRMMTLRVSDQNRDE